jgi:hypothetical protein
VSSKRPWLIGCGIGCAAAILVVGLVLTGSYFFLKRSTRQAEDFSARVEEMNERFGPLEDHRLAVDPDARRESVARFLAVREELHPAIVNLEGQVERLADRANDGRFGLVDMVVMTRDLPRLVSTLLDYLSLRADVLLSHDMSLGEYLYLYAVVYYVALGNSPDDGPPFPLISDADERPQRWNQDETKVRRERTQKIRAILHDLALPMLQRQLEDADGHGEESWRTQLAAEIDRMERHPSTLPWEDDLPADLRGWIDAERGPLQSSYSPLLNPIEVGTHDQE